ncbi:cysteine peptidase family C39 domain-containing protein [Undibacterium sp. SXout11W]|uniref:cysteine peptidase family C39 domain-containing protein n=1 Tax=Undibacterium sp. SXout11W TaxID=3413050 RepID=UPI003BF40867
MKSLLQTESSECGLACLTMIASHYGHHLDLADLRRQLAISLKGATLAHLQLTRIIVAHRSETARCAIIPHHACPLNRLLLTQICVTSKARARIGFACR